MRPSITVPGTTGWGTTFGGCPAVSLESQAKNLGVQSNQFGFAISGSSNLVILAEPCTNLADPGWSVLRGQHPHQWGVVFR